MFGGPEFETRGSDRKRKLRTSLGSVSGIEDVRQVPTSPEEQVQRLWEEQALIMDAVHTPDLGLL